MKMATPANNSPAINSPTVTIMSHVVLAAADKSTDNQEQRQRS